MTQTAKVYGESLYELAREEQVVTEILSELKMVCDLFRDNPRYVTLLSLPGVPKQERCGILDESFRGKVNQYLLNFMKILVENGTIRELPGCESTFRHRYYEDNGILSVTAVSAAPISEELTEKLRAKLAQTTGKTIELSVKVDPSLLGGVRLEMDGKRFDGTVKTRLDEIRRTLDSTVL